jgi:hypothetical protein
MSVDKTNAIRRVALGIVRREMHEYDMLASTPRLRYEHPNAIDTIVDMKFGSRSCAHGRALHTPCVECERSDEDCKVYIVAAQQRIKDLLAQLGE